MHILCPHCRSPIELVKVSPEEILCPSCGSTFRVEGEATATWGPGSGSRRLGRFELIEAVGTGAFGTVYKARDMRLDRVVAVKVPRAGNLGGGEDRDRFVREARSAAQLRHPAIVPVHEVGEHDGTPYIVSEFVEGVTLSDWLTARKPSFRETASLVAGIAEALHYAHGEGVVHRDIKPSNIMLDEQGSPHVMDFGLAKRDAGEVTMTVEGQVLGTPAYMSPEQARGEAHAVDGRSDVYSLGVVLYLLLTGELPFRGATRMLLHQVLHDEPKSPRSLNDRIPRDLETITLKAAAKEPGRRYATAGELAADLRRYMDGASILARPTSAARRVWLWAKRRPAIASLSALTTVVTLVGIAGFTWAFRQTLKALDRVEFARQAETEERKRADLNLYLSSAALANRELLAGNYDRADQLLQICPADLRGPEWPLLVRRAHPEELTFRGHTRGAGAVAFSPDGKHVASADESGLILIWDSKSGKIDKELRGHSDRIMRLVFHPAGHWLASASLDHTVRLWNPLTGALIRTWSDHTAGVSDLAVQPGGRIIASAGWDGTVRVWDPEKTEPIRSLRHRLDWSIALAFDPEGRRLAVLNTKWDSRGIMPVAAEVTTWSTNDWTELRRFELDKTLYSNSIAFRPHDGRLLVGGFSNVEVWDPAAGIRLGQLEGPGATRIAIDVNGRILATSTGYMVYPGGLMTGVVGSRKLLSRDPSTGRPIRLFPDPTDLTVDVAVDADGMKVATAGADGTIRIWNGERDPRIVMLDGPKGKITRARFSPDGRLLAVANESKTHVYEGFSGTPLVTIPEQETLDWSPQGDRLLVKDTIYDAGSGRQLLKLEAPITGSSMLFGPDGQTLVGLAHEFPSNGHGPRTRIRIWRLDQGNIQARFDVPGVATSCFSPDGKLLVTGEARGSDLADQNPSVVRVWDVATGALVRELKGHPSAVYSVAYSPNKRQIATAGADRTVRLWDSATGREQAVLRGHTALIYHVAFSPDGRRMVSLSNDQTARIWDVSSHQLVFVARGLAFAGGLCEVGFLDGSSRLVALVAEGPVYQGRVRMFKAGRIQLWHIDSGQELLYAPLVSSEINLAALAANGHSAAVVGRDGTIELFDLAFSRSDGKPH